MANTKLTFLSATALCLTGLVASCSSDPATDSAANPATDPAASPTSSSAPHTIDGFASVVEQTIGLPRLLFESDVIATLPGSDSEMTRSLHGRFDEDSSSGESTFFNTSDGTEFADALEGEPIDLILVDDILWVEDVTDSAIEWNGRVVDSDGLSSDEAVYPTVNGDVLLRTLALATTSVITVEDDEAGGTRWTVMVDADRLVTITTAAGTAEQLSQLGVTTSGIEDEAVVYVSDSGFVTRMTADLSDWWINGESLIAGAPVDDAVMRVDLRFDPFDEPLNLSAPCDDPAPSVDGNGSVTATC